ELPDQLRVLALIASQLLDEPLSSGMRDRAELLHDLVACHAYAVVRDADRLVLKVYGHDDREFPRAAGQLRPAERLEAELVVRIRCVRDQLPKKDLPITVERVHHRVQQLLRLGLESVRAR